MRTMDRVLHDCEALGAPPIRLDTRFGHEPCPPIDELVPWIDWAEHLPPDGWTVYVRIVDPHFSSVALTGAEAEEAAAYELADRVQHAVIDLWQTDAELGSLYNTWPRCPRHATHPIWPHLVTGAAVWQCKADESIHIGSVEV